MRFTQDLLILFVADLVLFTGSLWLALVGRHFDLPSTALFFEHLIVFLPLFCVSVLVFVTVGLYDKHVALFEHKLTSAVVAAQCANLIFAIIFFFLAPTPLQPKTILLLYITISTLSIVVWRLGVFRLRVFVRAAEKLIIVGTGPDIEELHTALISHPETGLISVGIIPSDENTARFHANLKSLIEQTGATLIATHEPLQFSTGTHQVKVLDSVELYEAIFYRVPLTLFDREAFLMQAASRSSKLYDALKRCMDLFIASVCGVVSLCVYPFVLLAIYLGDRGGGFVIQERVGEAGALFKMWKFRSMSGNDHGAYGREGRTALRITRVGSVLRSTRIDELPQLWSVLLGHQSLVGPRPELPALVETYRKEIPHYDLRHVVPPGLSGWAQIYHQAHPHHGADVEETARKLSYDLYYIKYRSVLLDLEIALKTIKILALRVGA